MGYLFISLSVLSLQSIPGKQCIEVVVLAALSETVQPMTLRV